MNAVWPCVAVNVYTTVWIAALPLNPVSVVFKLSIEVLKAWILISSESSLVLIVGSVTTLSLIIPTIWSLSKPALPTLIIPTIPEWTVHWYARVSGASIGTTKVTRPTCAALLVTPVLYAAPPLACLISNGCPEALTLKLYVWPLSR